MPPSSRLPFIGLLVLLAVSGAARPAIAQDTPPRAFSNDRIRIGISLGGTGFLGLISEYQRGDWSAELTLGTISFREIAVAVAGKRYFSSGHLRPAVGVGFWSLTAWTEDGSGSVFIFRVPIAVDWNVRGGHALGFEVGLNRALAVDRLDPEDDTPPSSRIVPIPGMYYRYGWAP
jgi:hypothetical protein